MAGRGERQKEPIKWPINNDCRTTRRTAGWATSGFALHLVYVIVCRVHGKSETDGPRPWPHADAHPPAKDDDPPAADDDNGWRYGDDAPSPSSYPVRCYSIRLAFIWNQLLVSLRQLSSSLSISVSEEFSVRRIAVIQDEFRIRQPTTSFVSTMEAVAVLAEQFMEKPDINV